MGKKKITKPGKHGPLYLYRIHWRERYLDGITEEGTSRWWGYGKVDAVDRFLANEDFESGGPPADVVKVELVYE